MESETVSLSEAASRAVRLPADHQPVAVGRIGVLLLNLGTPDATDYWSMRRYLKEFLSDRRVIETPRILWWPLLNGVILTTRPARKGRDYETIWNRERNESPLKTITRSQAEKLAQRLASLPGGEEGRIVVDWAMRYGNPSIKERLEALQRAGCDRILLVPLYPQYAAATTATACDKAFEALMRMRWQPTIRVSPPYHDDPVYIGAVVDSLKAELAKLAFEPEIIIASFHGVPKDYHLKGDPYHCQCQKTVRLMREALGLPPERLLLTFQSRFGRAEWLQPYTDMTVKGLAEKGVKRLAVITPGFSADCLETLEEIAGENAEIFREHGGEHFAAIPCLNDSPEGMRVIEHIVRRELQGWI
ncbi:MAG: ferrochelatase [Pseudomonadota bacterium]|jgi:ferrochelatase|nr:MAG: ferrochelatase [Pseudomonadota bacterium]